MTLFGQIAIITEFLKQTWLISLQLRLLTNELSIEEVIRNRTNKILHEKCRDHLLWVPVFTYLKPIYTMIAEKENKYYMRLKVDLLL